MRIGSKETLPRSHPSRWRGKICLYIYIYIRIYHIQVVMKNRRECPAPVTLFGFRHLSGQCVRDEWRDSFECAGHCIRGRRSMRIVLYRETHTVLYIFFVSFSDSLGQQHFPDAQQKIPRHLFYIRLLLAPWAGAKECRPQNTDRPSLLSASAFLIGRDAEVVVPPVPSRYTLGR